MKSITTNKSEVKFLLLIETGARIASEKMRYFDGVLFFFLLISLSVPYEINYLY